MHLGVPSGCSAMTLPCESGTPSQSLCTVPATCRHADAPSLPRFAPEAYKGELPTATPWSALSLRRPLQQPPTSDTASDKTRIKWRDRGNQAALSPCCTRCF